MIHGPEQSVFNKGIHHPQSLMHFGFNANEAGGAKKKTSPVKTPVTKFAVGKALAKKPDANETFAKIIQRQLTNNPSLAWQLTQGMSKEDFQNLISVTKDSGARFTLDFSKALRDLHSGERKEIKLDYSGANLKNLSLKGFGVQLNNDVDSSLFSICEALEKGNLSIDLSFVKLNRQDLDIFHHLPKLDFSNASLIASSNLNFGSDNIGVGLALPESINFSGAKLMKTRFNLSSSALSRFNFQAADLRYSVIQGSINDIQKLPEDFFKATNFYGSRIAANRRDKGGEMSPEIQEALISKGAIFDKDADLRLAGEDLRGLDLREFDLTNQRIDGALIDETTKLADTPEEAAAKLNSTETNEIFLKRHQGRSLENLYLADRNVFAGGVGLGGI